MNYIIIALSFIISTYISVQVLKKKNNKLVSMLIAFCLNTLILTLATWLQYLYDEEIKIFGISSKNTYILIIAIPIITWLNFLILQFANRKRLSY